MRNLTILIATLACWAIANGVAFSQEIARGVVYDDANRNLLRERNEKGIAGVAVSNGVDIAVTDARGGYSLPVAPGNTLFVIKPSGWLLPVNELNQPRFYYIHKPEGSPELRYKGSSPTGKLPASVDFPLVKGADADTFRMVLLGDPQPYTLSEVEYFRKGIIGEIKGLTNVAFGLSLGDLVGDDLSLFPPYKEAIAEAGLPWFHVMGNHDMNYDAKADSLSDESFENEFGPATYSFNYGKVHFVVLDDVLYPDPRDGRGYWGGFTKSQLKYLENDLKLVPEDHLVVLAFHIPISEREGGNPFREADRLALFNLLKPFRHTLSLSAHTHFQSQDFFGNPQGWLRPGEKHHHLNMGASCGDWYSGKLNEAGLPVSTMRDGTPKGYAFLNFSGNQYTFDYKVAGQPASYQFTIHAPRKVAHKERTSAGIFANFFAGSPSDTVMVRVDSSEWKPMRFVETFDPAYTYEVLHWDFADTLPKGRRPSNPTDCNHLWRSAIPTDLPLGRHTIEVKATDRYGRTFSQKSSYTIVGSSGSD